MSDNTTIPGGRYITEGGVVRDANGRVLEAGDAPVASDRDAHTAVTGTLSTDDKSKPKQKK